MSNPANIEPIPTHHLIRLAEDIETRASDALRNQSPEVSEALLTEAVILRTLITTLTGVIQ